MTRISARGCETGGMKRRTRGFTLIEIIAACAVASRCWSEQPPHTPKHGQHGGTLCGLARRMRTVQAWSWFGRTRRTSYSTVSRGSAPSMKTVLPPTCAIPRPSRSRDSTTAAVKSNPDQPAEQCDNHDGHQHQPKAGLDHCPLRNVASTENNGVRRRGHRQHEGERGADADHDRQDMLR